MKRILTFCLYYLCYAFSGMAQVSDMFSNNEMAISYDEGSGIDIMEGTGKAEHYDVAIFLDDLNLVGKSIVGVRIPFVSIEDISGLNVWLASELELSEDNLTIKDLYNIDVNLVEGWSEVKFENPIEINSQGVYVGYSFEVDRINSNNLKPLCLTSIVSQNGFFIHTSRTSKYKKWTNCNKTSNIGSLRLQAMVTGMDANAASIEIYPKINVQLGETAYVPSTITCHGYNGISSIEYEYNVNGKLGYGSYVLENPITPIYNKSINVDLALEETSELGQIPFSINITKVNGGENSDLTCMDEGFLNVFDFVPIHRPLMEEYTGGWCGNCPRGIAGIETMKELYPDDFICISYHNSDAMEVTTSYPSEIRGFPDSWISRIKRTDPFFGDQNDGQFHFNEEWEIIKKEPTTVSLDVVANWEDEDESVINVVATFMSQIEYSSDGLAIGCALVADDLTGTTSKWLQQNYYSGQSETCAPELKWIAELPSIIRNFHFNDVLILGLNLDGSESNLPYEIEPMTEYTVSFRLPLDKAINTDGESLVQDKSKLKVVCMCINRNTSEILNSNQSKYMGTSNLSVLLDDSEIIKIDYLDLFGHTSNPGATGVILKVIHYRNGKRECFKLFNW